MSDREIAATNQLENIDMHLSNSTTGSGIRREWTGSSVQKVAHDFLHGLKVCAIESGGVSAISMPLSNPHEHRKL